MSDALTGTIQPMIKSKEGRHTLADRATIWGLVSMTVIIIVLFVIFVVATGLLHHQISARLGPNPYDQNYLQTAANYREERIKLLVTYRTFMVALGLTVGLAICSIGALIAMRHVLSRRKSPLHLTSTRRLSFAIAANSPGIIFMLAGVTTIFVVQCLTPPIADPQIAPTTEHRLCSDDPQSTNLVCRTLMEFRIPQEHPE
ncbi:hypothetical protein SAMN06273572_102587 [Monaibacterium marinum]|uniref:Uncharacterized protein n=1 Tax=Pontivivens marinum TaxID=1690039 RepID=A0A2C9CRS0_9RHOB|nr:hypothetical protein [Monaibacterium marinum]SOH93908.1 hypothetical protein SAMN06273572_102587 [Monaibacterium marinum]